MKSHTEWTHSPRSRRLPLRRRQQVRGILRLVVRSGFILRTLPRSLARYLARSLLHHLLLWGGVSIPYTFQGYIDQALLDDIEEFVSLGWLNGRVLDMVVGEESDSEPLA